MPKFNSIVAPFKALATQDASLNWYAIADSAQHKDLPAALLRNGRQVKCLLGAPQGSLVARHSPHLVHLDSPIETSAEWSWISLNATNFPCLSVIATHLSFDVLFQQLAACTEVVLPDDHAMLLAFWDPAILGTLLGQADDPTIHVQGPVLDSMQRSMLTSMLALWCYWDREGGVHLVDVANVTDTPKIHELSLAQDQVDDLVEASVPDHILSYIELNHSQIIEGIPANQRYRLVCTSLSQARAVGLKAMRDLLNYSCAALFYGTRMSDDPEILYILNKVKRGEISFFQAAQEFPD